MATYMSQINPLVAPILKSANVCLALADNTTVQC